MKKVISIIAGILVVLVLLVLGLTISWDRVNQRTERVSHAIVAMIEAYYAMYHHYPSNIQEELDANHLQTTVRYGLIHTEITIQFHDDMFEVYYFYVPLGPFHGYDSRQKDWGSFE